MQLTQALRVEGSVGAVEALALSAAEQLVGEALAVEFETLRFLTVTSGLLNLLLSAWGWRLYTHKRVVLEHVLQTTVPAQLDRVQSTQLNTTSLPPAQYTSQQALSALSFALNHGDVALVGDFVADFATTWRQP